ncbi:MAG: cytochrome c [Holophagales bacterium]|nr:cytochrome c [Holophagales bacterium]
MHPSIETPDPSIEGGHPSGPAAPAFHSPPRAPRSRISWLARAAMALTLLALSAPPAVADEPMTDEERGMATLGRHTYRAYCGTCHGAMGKGDGVLASVLVIPPTDLTVLAAENGGEFPAERTHKVIEGREKVKGHGDGEMPAWGPAFEQITENEEQVQAKIEQLVIFLKSIQQE